MPRRRRYWVYGIVFVIVSFALYSFVPLFIPNYYPCSLPSLESPIPSTTLEEVGTSGYFEDQCPAPIPSVMEFERSYGTIRMHWWGSPHRLYMVGTTADGVSLDFGGSRVEPFEANWAGSLLADYSNRVTFSGGSYIESTSEQVLLEVYDGGALLERLELRYVPIRCECVASEGL